MKKLFPLLALAFGVMVLASCERCKTCSITNTDGTTTEEEFCSSGPAFNEGLDRYEDNGWSCK
ncbi:MAG: hypothetical protein ACFB10_18335 [Salibacteraceae bacterium]